MPNIEPVSIVSKPLQSLPVRGDSKVTSMDTDVEFLFAEDDSFCGPESLVFLDDDTLVTGLSDGRVVKVTGLQNGTPKYDVVTRTGKTLEGCGSIENELTCGRPLGMKLDPLDENRVIVADNQGILLIDLTSGNVEVLVDPEEYGLKLNNDVEVEDNGDIYWTHSGPYNRQVIHYVLLECAPNGKLYKFVRATKEVIVLKDDLTFPNGLTMTHDHTRLLIDSCCTATVNQFYLSGPKKGVIEPFITDLPGGPDNIRRNMRPDGQASYLVGLGTKQAAPFALLSAIGPYPWLKRIVASLPLEFFAQWVPRFGIVIEIVENASDPHTGAIEHYYMDYQDKKHDDGRNGESVYWASEAEIHGNYIYIGSWKTPYLSRMKLSQE
eukprot:CFRG5719T1